MIDNQTKYIEHTIFFKSLCRNANLNYNEKKKNSEIACFPDLSEIASFSARQRDSFFFNASTR